MFNNFFIKGLLKSKLKNARLNGSFGQVPQAEQDKIFRILEKNPEFFMKIAGEMKEKAATGIGEQQAAMAVLAQHKSELEKLLNNSQ